MYLRIAPVTTYEWTRLTALVADRWQAKDAYRTAELTAEQTTKAFDEEGGRTLLVEAGTCGMAVHVAASAEVTPADVDRMVADLRIADCTDPATWPPVTR
jgi:hypothetical protein